MKKIKLSYSDGLKRYLDLVLSFEGLAFFWWVYPLCAIAIKLDDPEGPILFKQDRIGQYGKVYKMLKFRSMKTDSEHTGSGVYSENDREKCRLRRRNVIRLRTDDIGKPRRHCLYAQRRDSEVFLLCHLFAAKGAVPFDNEQLCV